MTTITMTYRTVRYYQNRPSAILAVDLTLEQAQEHCSNPETSSTTCETKEMKAHTDLHGPWFDGYEKES